MGLPLEIAGRMGSVAATYAVERHGSQEHAYTPAEFVDRFETAISGVRWRGEGRMAALPRRSGTGGAPALEPCG